MASIGHTLTGPRFHETDEVREMRVTVPALNGSSLVV